MSILVGDKSTFAIESGITSTYEGAIFQSLGFIVFHIADCRYGIHAPDATMLGGPLFAIKERITRRGSHIAPFATESDAGEVADAFRDAIYAPDQEHKIFFGLPQSEFSEIVHSNNLEWAADLDEAFDDSSYLLQFDVGSRVRLIAFTASREEGDYHHSPGTLRDVSIEADRFYGILEEWWKAFEAEWMVVAKTAEQGIGGK